MKSPALLRDVVLVSLPGVMALLASCVTSLAILPGTAGQNTLSRETWETFPGTVRSKRMTIDPQVADYLRELIKSQLTAAALQVKPCTWKMCPAAAAAAAMSARHRRITPAALLNLIYGGGGGEGGGDGGGYMVDKRQDEEKAIAGQENHHTPISKESSSIYLQTAKLAQEHFVSWLEKHLTNEKKLPLTREHN